MFYSFYDDNSSDIFYKDVPYCYSNGGTYSLKQSRNEESKQVDVFPNPFSSELKVSFTFDYAQVTIFDVYWKKYASHCGQRN